ncbi:MAG: hypothetical protein ACXAC5_02375 [Promethearchaeota archaeon]|jgi:hypothetical protein
MGGTNQATCPPAAVRRTAKAPSPIQAQANPIRYHEVSARGEVDFHDDKGGIKCAVESAAFFTAYHDWRARSMSGDLVLAGNDGAGGHATVKFMSYPDNQGEMQVAIVVTSTTIGQTVLDLDKLAGF